MISQSDLMLLLNVLLALLCFSLVSAVWRFAKARRLLEEELMEIIIVLSSLMEMKDGYTEGHCARIKSWASGICRELGMKEVDSREVVMAAVLHDIGKIGLPDVILQKPGKLDDAEYAKIKGHPVLGAAALASIARFARVAVIIRHHHEAYDGSGYPSGLIGKAIPLGARIVAVIDAYDAMTSTRPYSEGKPMEEGVRLLRESRGHQFDPEIVDIFCRILTDGKRSRTDPVCGMAGERGHSQDYRGESYYFCSDACRKEFSMHPEKYAARV